MIRYLLLCLFLLPATDAVQAQVTISDYSLRHFTSENGLAQNSIKSIAQDDYGFIWLATESGLLRFDGSSFKIFDKSNTGIHTSRIMDIRRSPDGKGLLAVTNASELLYVAGGKVRSYAAGFHDFFLPGAAKQLDLTPVTWMQRITGIDSLFFNLNLQLGALVVLHQGITWYTGKGNVTRIRFPAFKESDIFFPIDTVIYYGAPGLAGDTLQRITPYGVSRVVLRGDFIKRPAGPALKHCFAETYPATGQTFLYTDQQLYQVLPLPDGSLTTRLLLSGFNLHQPLIYCTYYDSLHQRVFMGSLTDGLYILDRKKFRTATYAGSNVDPTINVIYDQVAYNDSTVLTGNGTLLCTNPDVPPKYKSLPNYTQRNTNTNPVFRSQDGRIWTCDPNKVYVFDTTATRLQNVWQFKQPTAMAEGADGRIWIGTGIGDAIYTMDPHRSPQAIQSFLPVRDRVMSLAFETGELMWVCTMGHLLRVNIRTRHVDTIAGLTDKMARGVYIPRPGEIWICTYEDGLFLWQAGRLTHFPTQRYPHLKTVHKILEDEQGFFWISTNYGLYQARRTDLLAYANDPTKQEAPYLFYYSKESGFLTNEFNGGSQDVGVRLGNGFFSFSSLNGVVFFRPSVTRPELPQGQIIIDKLEVDDRELPLGGGPVTLSRNFRTLKITPVSAYMGNPANQKYEFRLNNDADWRNTYDGAVILSSLPSGHNEIYIRKKIGFGNNQEVRYKLSLYVPPAWWQTLWFYCAAFAGLLLLVWLITRLRVRHWRRRNALLEAAIQHRTQDLKQAIGDLERSENRLGEQLQFQRLLNENITHDITTPLKYLAVFTGDVWKEGVAQDRYQHADIAHIHQGTSRIYEVVKSLGQYMRARIAKHISSSRFNVYQLVQQKAELFSIVAAARHVVIGNNVDPALSIRQNESLIGIVIHNLIDNAVKHTEHGSVVIDTYEANDRVVLRITDTGNGLTPAQIQAYNSYFSGHQASPDRMSTGFGFLIIKEIAVLLKLEISMESVSGQGIRFLVAIPRDAA